MRRLLIALAAVVVVAAGLGVHFLAPTGFVTDAVGDTLYAALIFLLVAFLIPSRSPWFIGAVALVWCVSVEFFQLTGLPEQWGAAFRPLMLVFGTVFSATDLLFYAAGVAIATSCALLPRLGRRLHGSLRLAHLRERLRTGDVGDRTE